MPEAFTLRKHHKSFSGVHFAVYTFMWFPNPYVTLFCELLRTCSFLWHWWGAWVAVKERLCGHGCTLRCGGLAGDSIILLLVAFKKCLSWAALAHPSFPVSQEPVLQRSLWKDGLWKSNFPPPLWSLCIASSGWLRQLLRGSACPCFIFYIFGLDNP